MRAPGACLRVRFGGRRHRWVCFWRIGGWGVCGIDRGDAEGIALVLGGAVGGRKGAAVAVAEGGVYGGHDLDAGLVELVLDVLVELTVDSCHALGLAGVGVDLVGGVGVVEAGLKDVGSRVGEDAVCAAGRGDEEGMDLAPGRVVADADGLVKDEGPVLRGLAEVDDLAAENERVGDGDGDVLDGADLGGEEALLGDLAEAIGDLDYVTNAEGAGVGEHDAGDDVCDRGAGAEGDEDSEKDRDALEGGRVGAGKIGEGDDYGEGDDEEL